MRMWKDFHGPNAAYVMDLYDRYLSNPDSVDPETREFFRQWKPGEEAAVVAETQGAAVGKIVGTVNLAQAIREHGHFAAQLDPLGTSALGDPALELTTYGLTEEDLRGLPENLVGGPVSEGAANAYEAIIKLRAAYSAHTGYDFDHVRQPEERTWLRHAVESGMFGAVKDPINEKALLERLAQVECFELFLHRIFPGKTRFSLEGLDMMVPVLDEVIGDAAEDGTRNVLIGMPHRGRLNVLAHILNKPYSQILAEFKDPVNLKKHGDQPGWTGDVKYHAGARRQGKVGEMMDITVSMAPNPSHLEAVNPVVEGMARAAGTAVDHPGQARFDPTVTLPILIHGDAAFAGQGVVSETLNFSRIHGYRTGGTIHIIANNQLGYTTRPEASRSTLYASDMAKGYEIPVIHVNADDPEACIAAARMAIAYRTQFNKDFLIDLIGYRRHGHNEGDEPSFTQPTMYTKIEGHPTVRELWANRLVQRQVIQPLEGEEIVHTRMEHLHQALDRLRAEEDIVVQQPEPPPPGAARRVKTVVPLERLRKLNEGLLSVPDGFTVNRKLEKAMQKRRRSLDNPDEATVDWSTAEELAFATILEDGIAIRFTGQDVERGTFSQRHATFFDARTGKPHTPLQALPQARAAFEIRNSPLSEEAAVGFEYGYNVQEPGRLVLWEAQYGDFINGAQSHIDEFITSARAKWGQTPSLVLLLPHGYEGAGPDHSSGRLERFLDLAAETNIRIANCTTAAQYFHLLRRQALLLHTDPLPLVVMTPKSLLRHPNVASTPTELARGNWQPVIDDSVARRNPQGVRRLVFCSGKIYVDLVTSEFRTQRSDIALVRMEQLYPFHADLIQPVLEGYPNIEDVVWAQEEPENMGAWGFMRWNLLEVIDNRWPLLYVGRRRNSSPSEGSASRHSVNQAALVHDVFNPKFSHQEKEVIRFKK